MRDQPGFSAIVAAAHQDDVEAVSQTLRNAGQAAHCQWVSDLASLPEVLAPRRAEMIFVFFGDDFDRLTTTISVRDRHAPHLPVLAVAPQAGEDQIARSIVAGAQDLITLKDTVRFSAVALRELRAARTFRDLHAAQGEAAQLRKQLNALLDESSALLVYVVEGIVTNVNPAWMELFGYADADDLIGTPVMDIFDEQSRASVKSALVACAEGKWTGHTLTERVFSSDGSALGVNLELQQTLDDGDPCVRISMEPLQAATQTAAAPPAPAHANRHPVTGLYARERFVQLLKERIAQPAPGVLVLAYSKPDDIGAMRDVIDPVGADQLTLDLANILRASVKPNDLYGQFGGDMFMVLLSRGNLRDARAWADSLRREIARHVFEVGDKSVSLTCTIGLALFDSNAGSIHTLMEKAQRAFREGRESGGDSVCVVETALDEESLLPAESVKQALMKDQFRLVFQPVASLQGQSRQMFDVLIRMIGSEGREIMPGEFLPTAQRNGLMKAIDRWVVANAIGFCVKHPEAQLFIRLSVDSIPDTTLATWVGKQIKSRAITADQLVFQITENNAEEHLKETNRLATQLKSDGCLFAIEHFGVGLHPLQVLEHVPADFIKVDGSLMQGLARDDDQQKKVRLYIDAAKAKRIETIAERVEDADTMAVLWQLGVEFIQGYYVQGPEEIVLETA